jgi:hypothetical protein
MLGNCQGCFFDPSAACRPLPRAVCDVCVSVSKCQILCPSALATREIRVGRVNYDTE